MLLSDLTHDTIFNYHCKLLPPWLLKAWCQHWKSFLPFEATKLLFCTWTTMEEGIQMVRELGMRLDLMQATFTTLHLLCPR